MSSIAATIEMMLAMLLLAALFVGVRLDRRLRALREGEAGFAKAVDELNTAALRAEAGLAELRSSIREAQVDLVDRLQDAKAASARLQQAMTKAGEVTDRLENAIVRAPAPPPPAPVRAEPAPPRVAENREAPDLGVFNLTRPVTPAQMGAAAAVRERKTFWVPSSSSERPSSEGHEQAQRALNAAFPAGRGARSEAALRSRARVDDDLFDAAPALQAANGGRR